MRIASSRKRAVFETGSVDRLPGFLWGVWIFLVLSSCAPLPRQADSLPAAYVAEDVGRSGLTDMAPIFLSEHPEIEYNRIGTPTVRSDQGREDEVVVDPDRATIYVEERSFTSKLGKQYTNLLYRVHFQEIPSFLFPFQISAGRNIGLFIIVTLNEKQQPVLYTTVQTCGCYLAFVPTSYLDREALPPGWNLEHQWIYGQTLPGMVDFGEAAPGTRPVVVLADISHRVRDFRLIGPDELQRYEVRKAEVRPLSDLERIIRPAGQPVSFYETGGPRKGYVRDSRKIWERWLISWWALDWRVGEDKKLGHMGDDSPVFYTSLKPWARQESDMRDFATFLAYWGWKL